CRFLCSHLFPVDPTAAESDSIPLLADGIYGLVSLLDGAGMGGDTNLDLVRLHVSACGVACITAGDSGVWTPVEDRPEATAGVKRGSDRIESPRGDGGGLSVQWKPRQRVSRSLRADPGSGGIGMGD